MTVMHWREDMSVGVPELDSDHKQMVDLLNRVHYLKTAGADPAHIGAVLQDLIGYVKRHFGREENMMLLAEYPEYERHVGLHNAMARRLDQFRDQFEMTPETFSVDKFYDFLADWLSVHIMKEDAKLTPYIQRYLEEIAEPPRRRSNG